MKKTFALFLALILTMTVLASSAFAGTVMMFPLKLQANPTTGYDWKFTMSEEGVVSLADGEFTLDSKEPQMVGVGGFYQYMVVGEKEGEMTLTCAYLQNDDPTTTVVSLSYTFTVDADLNVYCLGCEVGLQ